MGGEWYSGRVRSSHSRGACFFPLGGSGKTLDGGGFAARRRQIWKILTCPRRGLGEDCPCSKMLALSDSRIPRCVPARLGTSRCIGSTTDRPAYRARVASILPSATTPITAAMRYCRQSFDPSHFSPRPRVLGLLVFTQAMSGKAGKTRRLTRRGERGQRGRSAECKAVTIGRCTE